MFNRQNQPPTGVNPQYSSFAYQNTAGFAPPSTNTRPVQQQNQYVRGVPGGGWDDDGQEEILRRPGIQNQPPPPPPPLTQHYRTEPVYQQPAEPKPMLQQSVQPGEYETRLVDTITAPGGVRQRPTDKDLADFSNKCKYLNYEIIGNLLLEKLNERERSLKTLHTFDYLLQGNSQYVEFLSQRIGYLQSARHTQAHGRVIDGIMGKLGLHSPPQTHEIDTLIF